jgi:hypothetical protein
MPPKQKKVVITTPPATVMADVTVAVAAICEFVTSMGNEFWFSISKNEYSPLQPIHELIDNAIAAILAALNPAGTNQIHVDMDFVKGIGTIEHIGGTTFPTDPQGLSRCFTYGGAAPTTLNEHGCGLKTSLAILDPANSTWAIFIKQSLTDMSTVKAPYNNHLSLYPLSEWPGRNKGDECGSLIRFPITKDRFKSLYSDKHPKMTDLDKRIECELSHMWMTETSVARGTIKLYYNGTSVTPFSFRNEDVHECVQSIPLAKTIFPCKSGGKLELEQIRLKDTAKNVKGSHWFKYAQTANGIYLFKNGRFIEKITDGANYRYIMGGDPHHTHNSNIIIANLTGSQKELPVTSTTKNSFLKSSPRFEEIIDIIAAKIVKPNTEHTSEEMILQDYTQRQKDMLLSLGMNPTFTNEKTYTIADGISSPPIDLVMELNNDISIYEAKRVPVLQVSILYQIFANFLCAKKANPDKSVKPFLLLNAVSPADARVTDQHKAVIQMFRDLAPDFHLTIQNYANAIIYKVT